MALRTYQAATMAQALVQLKRDMGRDAVIVRTRSFRKGGFFGLVGGRPMWEIVASSGPDATQRPVGRYVSDAPNPQVDEALGLITISTPPPAAQTPAPPQEQPSPQPATTPSGAELSAEVAEIRRMVQSLMQGAAAPQNVPAELLEIRQRLIDQDVSEDLVGVLIGQLRSELTGAQLANRNTIRQKLTELVAQRIRTAAGCGAANLSGSARVVALIGPTGVGKTTTIAKMAANLKLRENKKVGLITIDTYRIAAVDQLRTYADIIEVPLRAVLTAGELKQAVESMNEMDVILVDTAGRSQNDRLRLNQLRSFLAACRADEVHLVVSATANRRCARNVLAQFGPLGANRIILTKLDEAETFGMILNLSADGAAAVSYVTTGQDVPDDIELSDAQSLAKRIVGD